LAQVKALQMQAPRQPRLVDVPTPELSAGDVLIRVEACGVCGSDLNAWRGVPGIAYPLAPGAPGHEVCGEVVELGQSVSTLHPGVCVTGLASSGFAEYTVAKASELIELPPGSPEVLLGEPLACAMNVVRRAGLEPGERLAVVGFGYLAALCVQLLLGAPREWLAFSRRESARQLAGHLGAATAYDYDGFPSNLDDTFDIVIEAGGSQQTLDCATKLVGHCGRLVIAGYHADGPRSVNMQSWNWKGIDVINAHQRDPRLYLTGLQEALALVHQHHLPIGPLITHQWPLDQSAEALAAADQHPPDYVKGVIRPAWQ
jgi:threonine dehydrogenase-like Zn-dependent dehydrogenase